MTSNSTRQESANRYFAPDYGTARASFRRAVAEANGRLESLPLACMGPNQERLTIDIAWFGAENPSRVLVHSSGLHGVEAFTGSAIQLQWLAKGFPALSKDSGIILVHVLNPYGMAWLRRFNENNVDLNRNFMRAAEGFDGAPEGYAALDSFLNPSRPPGLDLYYVQALRLLATHGMNWLKQAIAGGQYVNPRGLFFGGKHLEEGPAKFKEYLSAKLQRAERIVAVDIHTGLGKFGDDQLLIDSGPAGARFAGTMCRAFGEKVQLLAPQGLAYETRGAHFNLYYEQFPRAEIYFATQEFGTYAGIRVLRALRAENQWHHFGSGTAEHHTKTALREIFNPRDHKWRQAVLNRGDEVIRQASTLAFRESR